MQTVDIIHKMDLVYSLKRDLSSYVKEEYPVISQYRHPYKKKNRDRLDFSMNEIHPPMNSEATNSFSRLSWGAEKRVFAKRLTKKRRNV